jgi:ADP-ribose pyrophosphatase YjhB (NUDIX family)
MSDTPASTSRAPLFALSSAVFAEREGQILILKRAVGEAVGSWYLPGGAVDAGETVEEGARRELLEECGLVPDGPLTCVAVAHMHVYGQDSLQVLYRCACPTGDVILSDEHSGARWIDPAAYRDRYFTDAVIDGVAAANERGASMLRNIRSAIDAYLEGRRLAGS